jgi:hypothetical protein
MRRTWNPRHCLELAARNSKKRFGNIWKKYERTQEGKTTEVATLERNFVRKNHQKLGRSVTTPMSGRDFYRGSLTCKVYDPTPLYGLQRNMDWLWPIKTQLALDKIWGQVDAVLVLMLVLAVLICWYDACDDVLTSVWSVDDCVNDSVKSPTHRFGFLLQPLAKDPQRSVKSASRLQHVLNFGNGPPYFQIHSDGLDFLELRKRLCWCDVLMTVLMCRCVWCVDLIEHCRLRANWIFWEKNLKLGLKSHFAAILKAETLNSSLSSTHTVRLKLTRGWNAMRDSAKWLQKILRKKKKLLNCARAGITIV